MSALPKPVHGVNTAGEAERSALSVLLESRVKEQRRSAPDLWRDVMEAVDVFRASGVRTQSPSPREFQRALDALVAGGLVRVRGASVRARKYSLTQKGLRRAVRFRRERLELMLATARPRRAAAEKATAKALGGEDC